MVKVINGKFFDIDTVGGKTAYTIAAMKYKKAMKERKKYRDINNTVINNVQRCGGRKSQL